MDDMDDQFDPTTDPTPLGWRRGEMITDGSACVAHDAYDVRAWTEALASSSKLQHLVDEAGTTLTTAPALVRDLFFSFYRRAPKIAPPVPLRGAYAYNRDLLNHIVSTTDHQALVRAGTAEDVLNAALATLGTAHRALAALDATAIQYINQLAAHEDSAADLFGQAEALTDLAEQANGDQAASLFAQAAALRAGALEQQGQAEAAQAQAQAQNWEHIHDQVRQAARQGMRAAEGQVDAINESLKGFGGGYDRPTEIGAGQPGMLTTKEKMALAAKVQRSPKLKKLAAMAGRFTRVALKVQESRTDQPPTEIIDVERGRDIRRMLPVEFLNLTDPDMQDLWTMRYLNRTLAQYRLEGRERLGQGPIILAIDSSGSMAGEKELWSKAVMLGLTSIARLQKRDMVVIHFSNRLRTWHFPKGQAPYEDVFASCEYFEGGGTPFEPWMREALRSVQDARYEKADTICISDGLSSITDAMQTAWNEQRRERGMRCYSILIGTRAGAAVLGHISDAVLVMDQVDQDAQVLETIFAV